jgi:hypothetical protein
MEFTLPEKITRRIQPYRGKEERILDSREFLSPAERLSAAAGPEGSGGVFSGIGREPFRVK